MPRVFYTYPAVAGIGPQPKYALVAMKVGEMGFHALNAGGCTPELLNPPGTTLAVIRAAIHGARFGWSQPEARACLDFCDVLASRPHGVLS